MRRSWRRIALPAVVLLLFAVAGGGLWVLTRVPSLTADALTRALGRRVELGSIEVLPGLQLAVRVRDLRIYTGEDPDDAPLLEAPLALGYQSWARVLVGQLVPLEWELEEPIARVAWPEGGIGSETPDLDLDLPLLGLRALQATVEVDAGPLGRFLAEEVTLEIARRTLLPGVRGRLLAKISGPGGALGQVDLRLEQRASGVEIAGDVRGVVLSRLRPLLPLPGEGLVGAVSGGVSGSFELDWQDDDFEIRTGLGLRALSLELSGLSGPVVVREGRLDGQVVRRDGVWTVRAGPFQLDDLALRGDVRIDARPGGRVSADLDVAPFLARRVADRLDLISLMALRVGAYRYLNEHLEAGTFEEVELALDLPFDELPGALAFGRALTPEELRFAASVRDVTLRPGDDYAPLEQISGRFALEGDRLSVEQLRLTRLGSELPTLDLEIDGFAQFIYLPPEELAFPQGPGVSLPGLGPAFRALRDDSDSDAEAEVQRLAFEDLRIDHPALLLQLRNASGGVRFEPEGMTLEGVRAVVAGGLANLEASWRYAPSAIRVRIGYVPGPAPPLGEVGDSWIRGRLAMREAPIGELFRLRDLRAQVNGRAGDLRLDAIEARLASGPLRGSGRIDLTQEGRAPIDFELSLADADAREATAFMELERGAVTGRASAEVELGGSLSGETSCLRSCDVGMQLELRDGTLIDMPIALQIARLPSLQGIRGLFGQALPYQTLRGTVRLGEGVLELEEFAIQSAQLRALLEGTIDLNTEERTSDLRVAFLFLQTLDSVIERLPYVGKMILGEDGSLVTMSFRVRGPFASPSVTPAAPATLQTAADWTGGWLRSMRQLIPGLRDTDVSAPTPEASAGEGEGEPAP